MTCIIFHSTIVQLQPLQCSSLVNLVSSPPVLRTLSLINSCLLPSAPRHCGSGNDLGDPLAPLCSVSPPCPQEQTYHLPLRSLLNVRVYIYLCVCLHDSVADREKHWLNKTTNRKPWNKRMLLVTRFRPQLPVDTDMAATASDHKSIPIRAVLTGNAVLAAAY